MNDTLQRYREQLVLADQKSIEQYDRAVLSLSGGALGISFVFLERIVGDRVMLAGNMLFWTWALWAASVTATLASFYLFMPRFCGHRV